MAKLLTILFMTSFLALVTTAFGCGVMPAGQVSTRNFTVTGFTTLPVAMVYAGKPEVSVKVSGIATSREGAQAFVERLVMQTVLDVLESQGRSALLSDAVISTILSQLTVKISYEPLLCQEVVLNLAADMVEKMEQKCIIVSNAVTGICISTHRDMAKCDGSSPMATITTINVTQLTIMGTLSTTNIIMAKWSRMMWQNVVNRAIRMLASGPFGSHFFSAFATVSGN
ncbi:hypothetical protein KIN20_006801 [Parelaphostrongylus tenuis]|uniref:Uncharacterized protein n=1 Tax=Parelaphostrongylus tenuis TaxID=148309 RepID=A0AAD5QIL9_PARTN|nr:hypothetical protein KIN20_006801 [Parelaphostrongylus tenuis]